MQGILSILGADGGGRIFATRGFERLRAGSVWVARMQRIAGILGRTGCLNFREILSMLGADRGRNY